MDAVITALIGAARSLVHPVILMILLVPMLITLAIWIGVGWVYWGTWTSAIQHAVVNDITFTWTADWDMARLASWIAAALVLAILASVVILTALGLVTVMLYFIPLFNLVAPVFSALAFIHLCLDELQRQRAEEKTVQGEVVENLVRGEGSGKTKAANAPP